MAKSGKKHKHKGFRFSVKLGREKKGEKREMRMGCIFGVCVSFMIRIEWLRFTRYEVKEGIWRLGVGVIRFEDDDDSSGLMNDGFEGGYCNFSVVSGFVGEKEMEKVESDREWKMVVCIGSIGRLSP